MAVLTKPGAGGREEARVGKKYAPFRIYALPDGSLVDSNVDAGGQSIPGTSLAYAKGKVIPDEVAEQFGEGEPNESRRFRLGSDGLMAPVVTRDEHGNIDPAFLEDDVKNDRQPVEDKNDSGQSDKIPSDDELRDGTNGGLRDEIARRGLVGTGKAFATEAKLSRANKDDLLEALSLLDEPEDDDEPLAPSDEPTGDESTEDATG